MNPIDQLKSVLCDPEGKCCIAGSDEDRAVVDCALQALAQPAQEPVAWTLLLVGEHHGVIGKAGEQFLGHPKHYERVDVYTTPPQRPWVGLTEDEIALIHADYPHPQGFAKAIQTKLKEKSG